MYSTLSPVSPEAFYSEQPPARIIGSECEYDIQVSNYLKSDEEGHCTLEPMPLSYYLNPEALEAAGFDFVAQGNTIFFLGNGAKVYIELGKFFEYCTPESLGPYEATLTDLAGIRATQRIINASDRTHDGVFRRVGNEHIKHSTTTGYHENHLIASSLLDFFENNRLMRKILPTYLATRVWAWGGLVGETYKLSQKANGIGGAPITSLLDRRLQQGNKPMVIIRRGDDVNLDPDWARVEVRAADPVASKWARFMSFAVTSLMLRAFEHPRLTAKDLKALQLKDPVLAYRITSADLSLKATHLTYEGRRLSAIDVQEGLAEIILKLSTKIQLPEDEIKAANLLPQACADLRSVDTANEDFSSVSDRMVWAARHVYLTKKVGEKGVSRTNPEAVNRDIHWDRILEEGGGLIWERKKGTSTPVSDDRVEHYVEQPPAKTRASIRSDFIKHKKQMRITAVGWSKVSGWGLPIPTEKDAIPKLVLSPFSALEKVSK